ncbi:hypothetical protein [Bradyrhizobium guangdongense]|uniref:hypothetical protein n=1 Tax=Bradyrhizobium guangdongense TaxID=1325090 RepID=UPI0013E8BFAA|nr:hypothetical protein [Bradyrhizobium guangdongense]
MKQVTADRLTFLVVLLLVVRSLRRHGEPVGEPGGSRLSSLRDIDDLWQRGGRSR